MSQQIGWSVESKLLYEIKQLTRQLSGRQYILTFPNFASFPTPGITGTLYVDESTGDIYVWNGTAYTLLSAGITALNGLIAAAQLLVIGSTGTDFNISSVGTTHTFNIPTASATNRGLLSSGDWTTFNNKQNAITLTTTGTSGAATLVGSTLNIPQYQSVLTNPVTGTGTTNYIPKFTAASTIGNSQIFDNGTNVGVGTASPLGKFHIESTAAQGATALTLQTSNSSGPNSTIRWVNDVNTQTVAIGSNYGVANNGIEFIIGTTTQMNLRNNGNLLVGTTTDAGYKTDIAGTLRSTLGANFATTSGNVGIGTASPLQKLGVAGNGQFNVASGSVFVAVSSGASNSLQIATDASNNYLYGTGAIPLTFSTNGSEKMRISSDGELLIGTTTDAGDYKLQVSGNAYVTGTTVLAATSGNVGIGTTDPDVGALGGKVFGVTGSFTRSRLNMRNLDATSAGAISGTVSFINGTRYLANIEGGTGSSSADDGYLAFRTKPNGVDGMSTRMYITNAGNVGIGTTTPQRKVVSEVVAANDFNYAATSANLGVIGNWVGYLYGFAGNTYQKGATFFESIDGNARGKFHIAMNDAATSANVTLSDARLTVTSAGNVGIGTTSPTSKLDVVENAVAINQLRVGQDATHKVLIGAETNYAEVQAIRVGVDFNKQLILQRQGGEVLIATSTDAGDYKLQVAGNQYISSRLVVGTTTDTGQTVQINSSLRLVPTSTVPTASAGTLYYDTATNKLKLYDGTSWVDLN